MKGFGKIRVTPQETRVSDPSEEASKLVGGRFTCPKEHMNMRILHSDSKAEDNEGIPKPWSAGSLGS